MQNNFAISTRKSKIRQMSILYTGFVNNRDYRFKEEGLK